MAKGRGGRHLPPFDFDRWEGVTGPDYTQFPDDLLDHVMPYLTGAEWKVLSYIVRKTFGWKKQWDYISTTQLERGIRDRETGEIVDRGTGLSRPTIRKAVKELEAKRLIFVTRQLTPEGDAETNCYQLCVAERNDQGVGKKVAHRSEEKSPTRRKKSYPTRDNRTRDNATLSQAGQEIALDFLRSIGYTRPAKTKRERAAIIVSRLLDDDGYSPDEVRAACEIAADLGARGPELIPHVIGQTPVKSKADEVGERLAREQAQESDLWQDRAAQFDALSKRDQRRLTQQAKEANAIIAGRPDDHPLVRAAAISLLEDL